jgi:hypothetical protein
LSEADWTPLRNSDDAELISGGWERNSVMKKEEEEGEAEAEGEGEREPD